MAEHVRFTFTSNYCQRIFKNKIIAVVGDSVMRCVYKDLILFMQNDRYLAEQELKNKAEDHSGLNDHLLHRTAIMNGKGFFEVREFQTPFHVVQFFFATRCYNETVDGILSYWSKHEQPDVVIMNSCLWDISRYGYDPEYTDYMRNMSKLCSKLRDTLPARSMFLWLSAMPVASNIALGFLRDEVAMNGKYLRIAVLDANRIAAQVINFYGFDILDLNYFMRSMLKLRCKDGVHWNGVAHRHITELIISFITDAYDIPLDSDIRNKLWKFKDCPQREITNHSVPSYVPELMKCMDNVVASLSNCENMTSNGKGRKRASSEGSSDSSQKRCRNNEMRPPSAGFSDEGESDANKDLPPGDINTAIPS